MGPVTGATLAAVLANLTDQLDQIIDDARQAGRSVVIQAGTEVNIAIENAKNAFSDLLDKAFKDVDQTVRSTVDQINAMLSQITDQAFSQLGAITDSVQQIVNTLPFHSHQPQVTTMSPDFVVPTVVSYPVAIRFKGNFEFAGTPGYQPVLSIGNQQFPADSATTQNLEFLIPVTSLFPTPIDPSAGFKFARVQLTVPWKTPGFLGIGHHDHRDSYSMVVGALPPTPGTLTLSYKVTRPGTPVPRTFTTTSYRQSSASDGGNDDHKNVPYSVSAETGWSVVRGTSQLNPGGREGGQNADWSYSFVSDDGNTVVYNVTTLHHTVGTSGVLNFTISFQEIPNDVPPVTDSHQDSITLKWGDSYPIPYPMGTWTLSFDAFDGHHRDFQNFDTSDPFIKINMQNGQPVVGTADPKTLQWP